MCKDCAAHSAKKVEKPVKKKDTPSDKQNLKAIDKKQGRYWQNQDKEL